METEMAWKTYEDIPGTPQDLQTGGTNGMTPVVHLWRVDRDPAEVVDFTPESGTSGLTWIVLSSALVPHARYRMQGEGDCAAPTVEFEVAEEARLPDTLGTLVVAQPDQGEIHVGSPTGGACGASLPAVISSVDLDLSDEAEPWSALLVYRTMVDDDTWAPSPTLAAVGLDSVANPKTEVFAECPDRQLMSGQPIDKAAQHPGLPEGAHSVMIEARLPGLDRVLRTPAKSVELSCEDKARSIKIDPSASSSDDCSAAPSVGARSHANALSICWMLALLALAHARALRRLRNARGVAVQRRNA